MKKIILSSAVAVALIMTSCQKKEHTCSCSSVYTYGGVNTPSSSSVTYKDVTKKNAKTLCVSSTQTDANGGVTTTSCELKD